MGLGGIVRRLLFAVLLLTGFIGEFLCRSACLKFAKGECFMYGSAMNGRGLICKSRKREIACLYCVPASSGVLLHLQGAMLTCIKDSASAASATSRHR